MTVDSTTAPFTAANRSRIVSLIVGATVNYVVAAFLGGAAVALGLLLWALSEGGELPGSVKGWQILGVVVLVAMGLGGTVGLLLALVRLPRARRRFEDALLAQPALTIGRPAAHPEIGNLVDALALAAGIPAPQVAMVDDPAPNSFSVGTRPSRTTIGVTTGLVETLSRPELEAVIAYEMTRVASLDVALCTWVIALLGAADDAPGADDASALTGGALRWGSNRLRRGVLEDMATSRDRAAVSLSKNPAALVGALERLAADARTVAIITPATAPLWIEVPDSVTGTSELRQFLLSERIGELRALAHLGPRTEPIPAPTTETRSAPPAAPPVPAPPAPSAPRHDGNAPFRPGPTSTST